MTDSAAFIAGLPEERRDPVGALLDALRSRLPEGFAEHCDGRMVHFAVPHSLYPGGYHCNPKQPLPFISVASTKGHIGLHHMGVYADPDLLRFVEAQWDVEACGKLDMGKGCLRFKKPEKLTAALPMLERLFERMSPDQWIDRYESAFRS